MRTWLVTYERGRLMYLLLPTVPYTKVDIGTEKLSYRFARRCAVVKGRHLGRIGHRGRTCCRCCAFSWRGCRAQRVTRTPYHNACTSQTNQHSGLISSTNPALRVRAPCISAASKDKKNCCQIITIIDKLSPYGAYRNDIGMHIWKTSQSRHCLHSVNASPKPGWRKRSTLNVFVISLKETK